MGEHYWLDGREAYGGRSWHMIQETELMPLVAGHRQLALLCDELETCADALPNLPSPEKLIALRSTLASLVMREEGHAADRIHAMLAAHSRNKLTDMLLSKIRRLHLIDAAQAGELIAALEEVEQSQSAGGEMLGYLMRCFFEGSRRGMDIEELAILTLAGQRLTKDARALLTESLARREMG